MRHLIPTVLIGLLIVPGSQGAEGVYAKYDTQGLSTAQTHQNHVGTRPITHHIGVEVRSGIMDSVHNLLDAKSWDVTLKVTVDRNSWPGDSVLIISLSYGDEEGRPQTVTKTLKNNGASHTFSQRMLSSGRKLINDKRGHVSLANLTLRAPDGQLLATAYDLNLRVDSPR